MHQAIQVLAVINFGVVGASHVLQHRAWGEFFEMLRRQGNAGALVNGFLALGLGSLIVSFHNVWTGIPIVLTIWGWALVVKGLAVFVAPQWNVRSMALVRPEHSRKLIVPGVAMLLVAAMLGIHLWQQTG